MTEDPREFGLTAADLRTAADRLYPPADPRLDPVAGTWGEAAQFGHIRSRLRDLADAIDPEECQMTSDQHDHARPGIDAQLATLATFTAILTTADSGTAHQAAETASCPACTTVAAAWLAITIAQELVRAAGYDDTPLAPRLLAMVQAAERDLRAAPN